MKFAVRILFVVGLGALLLGGFDVSLLLRGTRIPEATTAVALGAVDGTSNVHLKITDFRFGEGIVIQKDDAGKWTRVWVPIMTPDGKWTPRPIVAHTNRIFSNAELAQLLKRNEITGIVSNGMQSLGRNQRGQFAAHYPTSDLSGAIALQIDGRLPSPLVAYPTAIVGLVALTAAIKLYFRSNRKNQRTDHEAASPQPVT